jgi:hypothetical protein
MSLLKRSLLLIALVLAAHDGGSATGGGSYLLWAERTAHRSGHSALSAADRHQSDAPERNGDSPGKLSAPRAAQPQS